MVVIYALLDPESKLIRYIGKTDKLRRRYRDHLSVKSKTHTSNWIMSLKDKNLKPIIEVIERVALDNWAEREQYWIAYYRNLGYNLTNLTDGGEGCYGRSQYAHTDYHRQLTSKVHSGKIITEEQRASISKSLTGNIHLESTKNLMSTSHRIRRRKDSPYIYHLFTKYGRYVYTTRIGYDIAKLLNCSNSAIMNHVNGRSMSVQDHIIHRINCILCYTSE